MSFLVFSNTPDSIKTFDIAFLYGPSSTTILDKTLSPIYYTGFGDVFQIFIALNQQCNSTYVSCQLADSFIKNNSGRKGILRTNLVNTGYRYSTIRFGNFNFSSGFEVSGLFTRHRLDHLNQNQPDFLQKNQFYLLANTGLQLAVSPRLVTNLFLYNSLASINQTIYNYAYNSKGQYSLRPDLTLHKIDADLTYQINAKLNFIVSIQTDLISKKAYSFEYLRIIGGLRFRVK